MSEEESQTPKLRGSDSGNEKPIDLSGAIPFMIDISVENSTLNDTKKETVIDEDDDDYDPWMYCRTVYDGTSAHPIYPSKEQHAAEKEVRAALFNDIKVNYYNNYEMDSIYTALSNSPMFQNNDGFTAINDFGLSIKTNIDSRNPAATFDPKNLTAFGTEPAENFGIAAANDEAETTVDDFFPAPFIPFTM
jgi:hypothetical protein